MLIVYLQSNLARPQIPAEFGSKVPTNIRQRYLNLIIDECLKLYDDEEEAFKRVSQLFSQFILPSTFACCSVCIDKDFTVRFIPQELNLKLKRIICVSFENST